MAAILDETEEDGGTDTDLESIPVEGPSHQGRQAAPDAAELAALRQELQQMRAATRGSVPQRNDYKRASQMVRAFRPDMDVDDWVEHFITETEGLDETDKLAIFRMKIYDACFDWYNSMQREHKFCTVSEWMACLTATYRKKAKELRAAIRDRKQKEGEDAGIFVRDVVSRCVRYNPLMTTDDKISHIVENVHPLYQDMFRVVSIHAKSIADIEESLRGTMEFTASQRDGAKPRLPLAAMAQRVKTEDIVDEHLGITDSDRYNLPQRSADNVSNGRNVAQQGEVPSQQLLQSASQRDPSSVSSVYDAARSLSNVTSQSAFFSPPAETVHYLPQRAHQHQTVQSPFPYNYARAPAEAGPYAYASPTPHMYSFPTHADTQIAMMAQPIKTEPIEVKREKTEAATAESQVQAMQTRKCYGCGEVGHYAVNCPNRQPRNAKSPVPPRGSGPFRGNCHYCGKPYHRAVECRKRIRDENEKKGNANKTPIQNQGN